jgi:hypothetical protein
MLLTTSRLTERHPVVFAKHSSPGTLGPLLVDSARDAETWGRRAAVRLLSRFATYPDTIEDGNARIRWSARGLFRQVPYVNPTMIDLLAGDLSSNSGLTASGAAGLLARLATNPVATTHQRIRVVELLAAAAKTSRARRRGVNDAVGYRGEADPIRYLSTDRVSDTFCLQGSAPSGRPRLSRSRHATVRTSTIPSIA